MNIQGIRQAMRKDIRHIFALIEAIDPRRSIAQTGLRTGIEKTSQRILRV